MATTNPENCYYKTAELVRDEVGCYYFVCLQCGKYFENLDDVVEHIEMYFQDETESNLLTPMYNEPECMESDDVNLDSTNIKEEPLEEYEDYVLSSQNPISINNPAYCPICKKSFGSFSYDDDLESNAKSLEWHLIRDHRRKKKHAKIFECTVCGKNSFTRAENLKRHELIHSRKGECEPSLNSLHQTQAKVDSDFKEEIENPSIGESTFNSTFNQLNFPKISTKNSTETLVSVEIENKKFETNCNDNKWSQPNFGEFRSSFEFSDDNLDLSLLKFKQESPTAYKNDAQSSPQMCQIKNQTLPNCKMYCPLCKKSIRCKSNSLELHLIRTHNRSKRYAQIYECTECGKNSFTRPHDLKRHELTHTKKGQLLTVNTKKNLQTKHRIQDRDTGDPMAVNDGEHADIEESFKELSKDNPNGDLNSTSGLATFHTTNPEKTGISCAICNRKFESYRALSKHLKLTHNRSQVYKCSKQNCGHDIFTNSFELHRHEMSHYVAINNKMEKKCIFCRRNFTKKWNLMKHEKRHLRDIGKI